MACRTGGGAVEDEEPPSVARRTGGGAVEDEEPPSVACCTGGGAVGEEELIFRGSFAAKLVWWGFVRRRGFWC